ncbi:MAG: thioesterase family protein [candidate division WOR-3 bacterium]
MFKHKIRVRYAETDQMGIVHHSNYVIYFEEARVAFMEYMGKPYHKMEKDGILVPVIEVYVKYLKPAYFGDEIEVRVDFKQEGIKFRFYYEVWRGEDKLAEGYTTHVYVDKSFKILRPNKIK